MRLYYANAENRMGVNGTNNIPPLPGNNNFKVMQAGAQKIGYKTVFTGNMAINSQPRDGRGSCQQIGFCFQGCKSGAKWSTLYTEIPKGKATGNLEVRPLSQVIHIEHDATGKVTGVVYADFKGAMQRQKARAVAVAGNSMNSPDFCSTAPLTPIRMALRTAQAKSDAITCATPPAAYMPVSPTPCICIAAPPWRALSVMSHEQSKRGFVGGYEMETISLGLPFSAAFFDPAPGAAALPPSSMIIRTRRACGSSARTCLRKPTG